METKHLSYFSIENFKRFDKLEVNDIGQFNLIVGDNNVGKTSLLEALLFDENYDNFIFNMWCSLIFRRLIDKETQNINFVDLLGKNNLISYTYSFGTKKENLLVSNKKKTELSKNEIENYGVQLMLNNDQQQLIKFDFNNLIEYKFSREFDGENVNSYCPFIAFNAVYDNDLAIFFSKVSISTQKLESVKSQMRYLIPNLVSIEISNAIIPQKFLIAIRESDHDFAKPLAQYGDGTVKLFRYLIEMDICEDKRLMIDEIDTGIHYSKMKDFLKRIIQTAKNKNVQIFATTHSKECLEYYKEAIEELGYERDARIIKLANTKAGIKSYTYNYEQFENALSAESEIR